MRRPSGRRRQMCLGRQPRNFGRRRGELLKMGQLSLATCWFTLTGFQRAAYAFAASEMRSASRQGASMRLGSHRFGLAVALISAFAVVANAGAASFVVNTTADTADDV